MRICILTIGSRGDVQPYVALGVALKARGYTVVIGTHQEFEPLIRAQGLEFHPVAGNPREILQGPEGQALLETGTQLTAFLKAFRAAAQSSLLPGFDNCLEAARGADLLIYAYFVTAIGYLLGEHLRIPSLRAHLQPFIPTRQFPVLTLPHHFLGGFLNRLSHQVAEQLFWQTFRDTVNQWAQQSLRRSPLPFWGPPVHSSRFPVLNAFSPCLVPPPADWPPWVHTTGFWFLNAGEHWTPPPELERFLAAGPAPVCIGFGSMGSADPRAMSTLLGEALKRCGLRGILLQGWGELEKPEPRDDLFLLEEAPHDWLYARVAAVVHHGGAGTTAAGLRAGKPTVTVPCFGDQAFWAWRVFGFGAGPRPIPRPKLTADRLAQALDKAVNQPRIAQRAQELQAAIRTEQGVERACDLISRLFGGP